MRHFTTPLGDGNVVIHAPHKGLFDYEEFRGDFPSGHVYGLDVESTYMDDLGQFAPDFRIRLIQFATRDQAWVLDVSDPWQRSAAVDLLSDVTVRFCSHTGMDVLAVASQLGVDITRRNIDTHILAVMASPDDAKGGADLKSSATRYGMPQLEEAETVMHDRFKAIWCSHVEEARNRATEGVENYFNQLWKQHCSVLFKDGKKSERAKKSVLSKLKTMRSHPEGTEEYETRLGKMWEALTKSYARYPELLGPSLANLISEFLPHQAEAAASTKGLTKTFGTEAKRYAWDNIPVDDESYLTYAGLDAIACRRLLDILVPLTGAPKHLLDREMWLAGASNRIQIRGALVDREMLDELHSESQEATDKANAVVHELTGYGVRQTAKLIEWFGDHGADWTNHPKTDKGAPSLAKDNLGLLGSYPLDDSAKKALDAMLEAQKHADALMKTQGVINAMGPDGRVRSTLKTVGTVTARMSSRGPNMQNFSKEDPRVRGVFIPAPGHVFIACDFAQIELRVVAALANEPEMIRAIEQGDDLHQLTADRIGVERPIGKKTNFLTVYGGGARALSEQAGIDLNTARETVSRFWQAYPAIARFNRSAQENYREVRTISQRRIPVGVTKDGEPRSYANLNYLVQSSARDLIVGAWQRFDQAGYGDMIWGLIHDEMVIEAPEDRVDEIVKAAQVCMTRDFRGVPIEAQADVLLDAKGVSRWGK